jgi:hypothetical protein
MDKGLMKRYEALKALVAKRRQPFDEFVLFLEKETSWLESPASTRFHLCEPSGLLKHSVGVAETLLKLRACLAPEISEESCVIVGLFHDVGKVGMPGKPLYLPNENEWEKKNRGMMYKWNPDVTAMGLAVRSLYIVGKYLPLSDAEAQAICYHDGQYVAENEPVAQNEEPLTLLVHWADYWTAHIFEDGRELTEDKDYFDRKPA